ncbi:MAG: hypothetical protein MRY64_09060 [Hyphomonadaceae bacterium]|nr:hypothetical protein [Hyphomonadaceae bacterium]
MAVQAEQGYIVRMENAALKSAYEKLLALPDDKQAEAAEMIEAFVANDPHATSVKLSAWQIEEVRRRLAESNPDYVPDAEMDAFFDGLINAD